MWKPGEKHCRQTVQHHQDLQKGVFLKVVSLVLSEGAAGTDEVREFMGGQIVSGLASTVLVFSQSEMESHLSRKVK